MIVAADTALPGGKSAFPRPIMMLVQAATSVSADPSSFFGVRSPSLDRVCDPRILLVPCPHTTGHCGIWSGQCQGRKSHATQGKHSGFMKKIQSLLQIVLCFPSFFIFTRFIDIHDFFTDVLVDFGESLCNFSFVHSFLCYSVIQTL